MNVKEIIFGDQAGAAQSLGIGHLRSAARDMLNFYSTRLGHKRPGKSILDLYSVRNMLEMTVHAVWKTEPRLYAAV